MITKEYLLEAMKAGKVVHNFVWWFQMLGNGTIIGGCSEPDCCELEFRNFEEMWNDCDEKEWEI